MAEQASTASVSIADFKPVKILGKGAFGKVFAVEPLGAVKERLESSLHKTRGLLALKQMSKKLVTQNKARYRAAVRERTMLQRLRHSPFCLQLLCSFQSRSHVYLVTEYYSGGNLGQYLRTTKSRIRNKSFVYLSAELVSGLGYIHAHKIVHRDLKPENIVLTGEGHAMIVDFGLAFHASNSLEATRRTGTLSFRAPETFSGSNLPPHNHQMADWWALGVTLLWAFVHKNPFLTLAPLRGHMTEERLRKFKRVNLETYLPAGSCPDAVKAFLRGLLQVNPRFRLGAKYGVEEIKKHAMFSELLPTADDWQKLDRHQLPPPVLSSTLMTTAAVQAEDQSSPQLRLETEEECQTSNTCFELFLCFDVPLPSPPRPSQVMDPNNNDNIEAE